MSSKRPMEKKNLVFTKKNITKLEINQINAKEMEGHAQGILPHAIKFAANNHADKSCTLHRLSNLLHIDYFQQLEVEL